jgi:hypothetical protein
LREESEVCHHLGHSVRANGVPTIVQILAASSRGNTGILTVDARYACLKEHNIVIRNVRYVETFPCSECKIRGSSPLINRSYLLTGLSSNVVTLSARYHQRSNE